MIAALIATVVAGCGSQKSTLPPSPGRSGAVALRYLAHDPEVYADAQIQTLGTVARVRKGRTTLYVLDGGAGGKRIVLEPSSAAAGDLGRRVRVNGIFTVTFQLGYEILISRIAPAATL